LLVYSRTEEPSRRTIRRYPSCLISWIQLAPDGGLEATIGWAGMMNPAGRVLVAVAYTVLALHAAMTQEQRIALFAHSGGFSYAHDCRSIVTMERSLAKRQRDAKTDVVLLGLRCPAHARGGP